QRVHDRRDGHGRRGHLLRPRPARSGAGRRGPGRRATRIVGRHALRRGRAGEVAEDHDGDRAVHRCRHDARARRTMTLGRMVAIVLRAGVALSTACLSVGLIIGLLVPGSEASRILLHAGLIALLATPVARVVVSIAQYVRERDWTFAALTTIVLVELLASA